MEFLKKIFYYLKRLIHKPAIKNYTQAISMPYVGVCAHFTEDTVRNKKLIDNIVKAGIKYVRYDFIWESIEPIKGLYNFSRYDAIYAQLRAAGLTPLFILDYGNKLYDNGAIPSYKTKEGINAFANFAAMAVKHFMGKFVLWEIWNEPNVEIFWAGKDPVAYSSLFKKAAQAMKEAYPGTIILGPATSMIPKDYIGTCLDNGILTNLTYLSLHPYRSENPETIINDISTLRKMLPSERENIPIIFSEWGATTTCLSEKQQSDYLIRLFLASAICGISYVFWYDLINDGTDLKDGEHNFGLLNTNFTPKLAHDSLQQLTSMGSILKRLPSEPDDYVIEFENGIVYWTSAYAHTSNGRHFSGTPIFEIK